MFSVTPTVFILYPHFSKAEKGWHEHCKIFTGERGLVEGCRGLLKMSATMCDGMRPFQRREINAKRPEGRI